MADTKWHLEGKWLEYCSCDPGCPCETMAPPTRGHCDGVVAMKIDSGHYGDVKLDGLTVAATFFFPRALHNGDGHMQPIIDERASPEQREALFAILSGKDQPAGTIFNIFSIIIAHFHDPVFAPVDFQWDVNRRTATLKVPNQVSAETVPIRNPVTDREERIRTVLPEGWTFYEAEVGSGTAKSIGDLKFDYAKRHSSLAHFALNQNGMAYSYDEAKKRYGLDNRR